MPNVTIKNVVKGNAPSLLDAEKANEVINRLNSLLAMEVSPQGFGKLTLGEKNAKLDLTPIRDLINQLSTTVSAFSQTTGGGGGGSGGTSTAWKAPYNALLNALATSSLSATCDPDTREITVTWEIDLPPFV